MQTNFSTTFDTNNSGHSSDSQVLNCQINKNKNGSADPYPNTLKYFMKMREKSNNS